MRKFNLKVNGLDYNDHYFIENLEDYKKYMTELNNKFSVSESEIKNVKTFVGHGHSQLTGISGMFSGMIEDKENRTPMLAHLNILHGRVLSDQLKHILKGDRLAINKLGGYFPIKPGEECEVIELDTDVIYSKEDIKINKWWGGSHFYAKIGNIDVVDRFSKVKWSSEKRAREVAIEYMNELNLKK